MTADILRNGALVSVLVMVPVAMLAWGRMRGAGEA